MIDFFIVLACLLLTLLIGMRSGRSLRSTQVFSVAHRSYPTSVLVASLSASIIGGHAIFGTVQNAYNQGFSYLLVVFAIALNIFLFGRFVFAKMAHLKNATSLGEMMAHYYGREGQVMAGIMALIVALGVVTIQVGIIGHLFSSFFHVPFLVGVVIGCGTFILYSSLGGIRSVISTDLFQFALIIIGIPLIFNVALARMGGMVSIFQSLPEAYGEISSPKGLWVDFLLLFLSPLLTSFEPVFMQRFLLAKDVRQATQVSKITALTLVPFFLVVFFIGLMALIVLPGWDPNHLLPDMITLYLPESLRGLALAGFLAAFMSTADSNLHVSTVSLVRDILEPLLGKKSFLFTHIRVTQILNFALGLFVVWVALYCHILSTILFKAFSLWTPVVLVPFIFALFSRPLPQTMFRVTVFLGLAIIPLWNMTLQELTGIDGRLPALLINIVLSMASTRDSLSKQGEGR